MSTTPEDSLPEATVRSDEGPPAWTNEADAAPPPRVGDFEIVSKLGAGAFGQV